MIRIMAGAGLAAIMLFSWLGQADAGVASGQSKKDDEMKVKKGYALIEEPLVRVPGGLSATLTLALFQGCPGLRRNGVPAAVPSKEVKMSPTSPSSS